MRCTPTSVLVFLGSQTGNPVVAIGRFEKAKKRSVVVAPKQSSLGATRLFVFFQRD